MARVARGKAIKMKRFLLSCLTIGLTMLAASAFRGFLYGGQQGNPDAWLELIAAVPAGLLAALLLSRLTKD